LDPLVIVGHVLRLASVAIISIGSVLFFVAIVGAIVRATKRRR